MKKGLALLLVVAMIFSLAACGKKPAEDKKEKTSEKVETKEDKKEEAKEEKKEKAKKTTGMVDVSGEDVFTTTENIEELSEERLKEIAQYFDEHADETEGMTY